MNSTRILYLGLDPTNFVTQGQVTHAPLIQIKPYPLNQVQDELIRFPLFTHVILTSKSTVEILMSYLKLLGLDNNSWSNKIIAAIGQVTAKHLTAHGLNPQIIAQEETAEGLISELDSLTFNDAHVFLPQSRLARPLLKEYFTKRGINLLACKLYDTLPFRPRPLPDLEKFDEIVFTSPSIVDAFLTYYNKLPTNKILKPIGPITAQYLKSKLAKLD